MKYVVYSVGACGHLDIIPTPKGGATREMVQVDVAGNCHVCGVRVTSIAVMPPSPSAVAMYGLTLSKEAQEAFISRVMDVLLAANFPD